MAWFVGSIKGCQYGNGYVFLVYQSLWLRLSALPKVAAMVVVLFDAFVRGCGFVCWLRRKLLMHLRPWFTRSSEVATLFAGFVNGC